MPEPISCPVCGANEAYVLFQTQDHPLRLPGDYTYVRCQRCGLVYLNPRPTWDERISHYNSKYLGYYDRKNAKTLIQRQAVEFGLRKRWRVLTPFVHERGRLLDIGCGSCDFLYWMQKQPGWQAFGIERNPTINHALQQQGTENIMIGDASNIPFTNESFDVVMLWAVLEHLEAPFASLMECVRVLDRGGILAIRTVIGESWGAKWFGPYWVGYDAPRVLTVLSKASLQEILKQAGLNILTIGAYFYDFHPFLWSFRNFSRARLPGFLGNFLGNLPHSWILQLITLPYFTIQTALGGNSFVTVLAHKP